MSDQIKSLRDAANTQPGSYISGGFQAVVSQAKSINTKTGKTMFKATLTEGDLSVDATSFSTDFAPHVGKLVKWVGMGLKRGDDYNGKPQISIGDKARWIPSGAAAAQPAPAQSSAPAPSHAQSVVPGVTVGMAVKGAIDILLKTGDATPENIWCVASDIIRISDKLQRGELAPEGGSQGEEQPF